MASNNEWSPTTIVTVRIPRPVIIFNGMNLQDWKNYFVQKLGEVEEVTDRFSYTKCLKTLMLAELCNCTLNKVGNHSGNCGLTVNFYFEFPNIDCLNVFTSTLESVDIVSKVF